MSLEVNQVSLGEQVTGFHSELPHIDRFVAPFSLRCGAVLIDYTLFASVIAVTTLLAKFFGGSTRSVGSSLETVGYVAAVVVMVFDLIVVAGLCGQSVGKWATGLRIERADGVRAGFARILLRQTVGYAASAITLGFGFLLSAIDGRGRALHDRIAGTVVVRERDMSR